MLITGMRFQAVHADNGKPNHLEANQYIEDIFLFGEMNEQDREYLCLGKEGQTLCDIPCEAVWVQIFSIYCPQCQKLAPTFNSLYRLINADPIYGANIKMIGIGAGNTDYEVKYYRKFYKVLFPLFPDPDFGIHRMLHEPRTPYIFLCKESNGKTKVLSVLDPMLLPQDQFECVKALLDRTVVSSKGRDGLTNDIILIEKGCHLWDSPNGDATFCLLKGAKVKKIETSGEWCKVETLGFRSNIQGWLHIK
jgi:thiol-disulfide isomerase/thioredoxin